MLTLRETSVGFDGATVETITSGAYTTSKDTRAGSGSAACGRFTAEFLGLANTAGLIRVQLEGTIDTDNDVVAMLGPTGAVRSVATIDSLGFCGYLYCGPRDTLRVLSPGARALEVLAAPLGSPQATAFMQAGIADANAPTQGPTGAQGEPGADGDPGVDGDPGEQGEPGPGLLSLSIPLEIASPINQTMPLLLPVFPYGSQITNVRAAVSFEVATTDVVVSLAPDEGTPGPVVTVEIGTTVGNARTWEGTPWSNGFGNTKAFTLTITGPAIVATQYLSLEIVYELTTP